MDFPIRWRTHTGYRHNGVVMGEVGTERRLFVTGMKGYGRKRESVVLPLAPTGEVVWRVELSHPTEDRLVSVFPNLFDVPGRGPCLFLSFGSSDNAHPRPGHARLLDCRDGSTVWEVPTRSHHAGNGSCLVGDLDGDGEQELVWWDSATIFCHRLATGEALWSYDDRVRICHGRPGLSDVNGDGLDEIVCGLEYADSDGSSSVLALTGAGSPVWRRDGFPDDLGSTPVIVADVDGDGAEEFLIAGLDLVHRDDREWSSLWCFDREGMLRYRKPCGCGGLAVERAPDGALYGVGVANSRDGGNHGVSEIRRFNLTDGSVVRTTPIPRTYLDAQNPVMADLDGDGRPEALVATGNPSGYGFHAGWPPYADLYAVNAQGSILWRFTVGDYVHQPFVGDTDGDGRNEIVIPGGDGDILCLGTPGIASPFVWAMTGGGPKRWYSLP